MSELWLKNNIVAKFKDLDGMPNEIEEICVPEMLPLCLYGEWGMKEFNTWLSKRGIPENREGLPDVVAMFGNEWRKKSNFASLADQYWIKFNEDETWDKINFFTNEYSSDVGNMFFKPWAVNRQDIDAHSPDITTNGLLRKRWVQLPDLSSCLIKAGSIAARQEPLSEVLVSALCEQLRIKNAGYDLTIEGSKMCSITKNFITQDTELVPLSFIFHREKYNKKQTTMYDHILRVCDLYEIPGVRDYLNKIIFIDYITKNSDRHLGNIAFIRDVNTLKFIGCAPIFDCGQAYWTTKDVNATIKSDMFGDIEQEIFELVCKSIDIRRLLNNTQYEQIIREYPGITDTKKDNLCRAIRNNNNNIVHTNKTRSMAEKTPGVSHEN